MRTVSLRMTEREHTELRIASGHHSGAGAGAFVAMLTHRYLSEHGLIIPVNGAAPDNDPDNGNGNGNSSNGNGTGT